MPNRVQGLGTQANAKASSTVALQCIALTQLQIAIVHLCTPTWKVISYVKLRKKA